MHFLLTGASFLAWLFGLRLANEGRGPRPWVIGGVSGLLLAVRYWSDILVEYQPGNPGDLVLRATLATIVLPAVAAICTEGFARLEGVLVSLIVVVVGTGLLYLVMPSAIENVMPVRPEAPPIVRPSG